MATFLSLDPRIRRNLAAMIAVGLALRIVTVFAFQPPLISDDIDYDALARSLTAGDGFVLDGKPTAYRPPGYPLLIAATYLLSGGSPVLLRLVQALADMASALLLFLLGRNLVSQRAGLFAAWILTLFPSHILHVSHLMSETVFTTVLLAVVYLETSVVREATVGRHCTVGLLAGIATLIRPTALVLLPLILMERIRLRPFRAGLPGTVWMLGAALIVLAPWFWRNGDVFGRVTLTSNAGTNFWIGNHEGAGGAYSYPSDSPLESLDDEFERSDLGFRLGWEFLWSHPMEGTLLVIKKAAHFIATDYWLLITMEYDPGDHAAPTAAHVYARLSPMVRMLVHLPFALVLIAGTAGIVYAPSSVRKNLSLVLTTGAAWFVVHLVFYAGARYRFPVVPLLMLTAGVAWELMRSSSFVRTSLRHGVFVGLTFLYLAVWTAEVLVLIDRTGP